MKKYNKVIIIDDNEEILIALKLFLKKFFNTIQTLNKPSNIHYNISQNDYDLILLDMNFKAGDCSGNEGIFWLNEILKTNPNACVICITAYGAINLAVKAMQNGAIDFIEKPWDEELLLASILRAAKLNESKKEINKLSEQNKLLSKHNIGNIEIVKGSSEKMQMVWHAIEKIAPTDANILITGENGTGKELIAKNIHSLSLRKDKPFISVDLGALSPTLFESELFGYKKGAFTGANSDKTGWFEIANGGTIFLDEIGNLNLEQQAKLLSVLQKKEISPVGSTKIISLDIRIISATNANLNHWININKFREDLLYRLNTIQIELPPLRNRKDDIPLLVEFYLEKFKTKYKKSKLTTNPTLLKRLQNYSWPGNIRELKHSIERAVIMSETEKLTISDLYSDNSQNIVNDNNLQSLNLEKNEKQLIVRAIKQAKGNYTKATELLGISRKTLYNKIEKYGI
ncbi:MAG: sigma-54 dependent transcriptional regulator [Bacteroidales bacterium]|nr:sigma-54 dependent transcriptional regulator [Bacteroidales bacterium]